MCGDAAGLARSRSRTYEKDRRKQKISLFDEEGDALRAVLWAAGPAPRARVRFRKWLDKQEMLQESFARKKKELAT